MRSLGELQIIHKNALVITAHPDDESLFMGGTIAEFKNWSWRILCVTDCDERYNAIRRKELLCACNIYKKHGSRIEPFMLGITKQKRCFDKTEIAEKIKDFLRLAQSPDIVFTHSKIGEYGHNTHRLIHSVVNETGLNNIYTFSSGESGSPRKDTDTVRLSDRSLFAKREAISLYLNGSQKTNLSRLRSVVDSAFNADTEVFHRFKMTLSQILPAPKRE